jgi:flagellar motor switch protein FliM
MGASANHLGRTKIARLLAAIGSTPAPEPTLPAASLYDWRDPHTFNAQQRNRLTQALGQVAARMTEVFVRSGGNFKVSLKTCTEHLAGDLCRRLEIDKDFCMAFAPDKGPPCGFVAIAPQTASAWATWLLGDSPSTGDACVAPTSHAPGRDLSALEQSLLSDLLMKVLDAFLTPLRTRHNLQAAGPVCQGQPNLLFELTEEVAQIVFEVKTTDQGQPSTITFLLPCSRLAALAGKTVPAETPKASPQELSRVLMEHLHNVSVTVTAVLASTTLTFQEVLELGPGDILLLDQPIEGPAQLVLDGRTVFYGRPARAEGEHAMVIVESESGPSRQRVSASDKIYEL